METSLPTTLRTGLSGHPTRGKSLPAISRCKTMETSSSTAQRGRLCGHRILRGRCHIGHHLPLLPPPPPPPPPPSGPTPEEIRQREAEEKTRLAKIEADRQRALAEKALEDKLRAERDSAAAKLAADQALIDASRNAADLQKQIDAQAALDKLAAPA